MEAVARSHYESGVGVVREVLLLNAVVLKGVVDDAADERYVRSGSEPSVYLSV